MTITPGVRFILNNLTLGLPPLVALVVLVYVLGLPLWACLVLGVVSVPVALTMLTMYSEFKVRREAEAAGAQLIPRVTGKRFGHIDILQQMTKIWANGYPGDYFWDRLLDVGPVFDMRILWDNTYITACPRHIQAVLATDFANFQKGPRFQDTMNSVLGTGVFNADGEMWKFHRSMTRPFFSKDRITHFEMFDRHAEVAINQMKNRFQEGFAVDFQEVVSRFTMDAATEFLLGTCVESLKSDLPYPYYATTKNAQAPTNNRFALAFMRVMDALMDRQHMGWIWPLYEFKKDATEEPMKVVREFIDPIIDTALEKKRALTGVVEKTGKDIGEHDTVLDHLLKETSDAKIIRDETINILLAGRDTTAATLTFCVYFLAIYPTVMQRLREEIISTVGLERAPTFEDIKNMKFLRAVINETLRLYPVVPLNVRRSINPTTLASENPLEKPYYIPADTSVGYSVLLMHRRKDLWGPDAEEFDPDRFLDDRLKKYLLPNPFIFLPFNAGPRICLGQQFAYNEVSFMLVRLLQSFSSFELDEAAFPPEFRPPPEWKSCPGRKGIEKICPKYTLTMYSGGGMWVKGVEAER